MRFIIEVPLDVSNGTWYQLCVCLTPEGVSEVVGAILRQSDSPPTIKVTPIRV